MKRLLPFIILIVSIIGLHGQTPPYNLSIIPSDRLKQIQFTQDLINTDIYNQLFVIRTTATAENSLRLGGQLPAYYATDSALDALTAVTSTMGVTLNTLWNYYTTFYVPATIFDNLYQTHGTSITGHTDLYVTSSVYSAKNVTAMNYIYGNNIYNVTGTSVSIGSEVWASSGYMVTAAGYGRGKFYWDTGPVLSSLLSKDSKSSPRLLLTTANKTVSGAGTPGYIDIQVGDYTSGNEEQGANITLNATDGTTGGSIYMHPGEMTLNSVMDDGNIIIGADTSTPPRQRGNVGIGCSPTKSFDVDASSGLFHDGKKDFMYYGWENGTIYSSANVLMDTIYNFTQSSINFHADVVFSSPTYHDKTLVVSDSITANTSLTFANATPNCRALIDLSMASYSGVGGNQRPYPIYIGADDWWSKDNGLSTSGNFQCTSIYPSGGIYMLDNSIIYFGYHSDGGIGYRSVTGNDGVRMYLKVNSAAQSGYFDICENGEWGNNLHPSEFAKHPTFVWWNDGATKYGSVVSSDTAMYFDTNHNNGFIFNSSVSVHAGFYPEQSSALPTSGYQEGCIYYNTTDKILYVSTETVVGAWSWKPN